jgi:hypothetical protein
MPLTADLFPEQARAYVLVRHALELASLRDDPDPAALIIYALADAGMEVRTVPRHWPQRQQPTGQDSA